jgi:hypothetical protein
MNSIICRYVGKLSQISKIQKLRILWNLMLSVLSPKKFGIRRITRLKNEIGHVK